MPGEAEQIYVAARRTLLDVLEALGSHRNAVVLVGAPAIHLHTDLGDLAVAPYTADADLALDPQALADEPRLEALLAAARFERSPDPSQVGTWIGLGQVPVDLLVPAAVGGPGRRSADLGSHGNRIARKARGLEAAIVDNARLTIGALESADPRRFEVAVAGPAALLVAKLHKIHERLGSARRHDDKDALDAYRLLRNAPPEPLSGGVCRLLSEPLASEITREALGLLRSLFGSPEAAGILMVLRATEGLEDPDTTAQSCVLLAADLLAAVQA